MRAIVLIIIVVGSLPLIMVKPYVGTLMWAWISYFNPHRLTWGIADFIPYAQIVAIVTLGAWLVSKEPKLMMRNAIIVLMLFLGVWVSFTTAFALVPDSAFDKWLQFFKILLMTYVTYQMLHTRERVNLLMWVIVLSVGVYGVKGGIFTIATGGNYMILGPDESYYEANNSVGIALCMILPLMRYLQMETKSRLVYWAMMAAMLFTGIAVLATYSRGAVLAIAGMLGFMWLKSRYKIFTGVFAVLAIIFALSVMPDKWYDRIESIQNYEEDWSSMERIKMSRYPVNVATERPMTGGGFGIFPETDLYPKYGLRLCGPEWYLLSPTENCVLKARTSHSVYFDMIGEHGFFGFVVFVMLLIAGMLAGQRIIAQSRRREELAWARNLAAMSQTCIVGFAIGGLFVNMTYFDLYYHVLAILAATQLIVARALAGEAEDTAKVPQMGGVRVAGQT